MLGFGSKKKRDKCVKEDEQDQMLDQIALVQREHARRLENLEKRVEVTTRSWQQPSSN